MKGLTHDELIVLTAGDIELPRHFWEAAKSLHAAGRANIEDHGDFGYVLITPAGRQAVRLHRIAEGHVDT